MPKSRDSKILMVLGVPPPFGGGELLCQALSSCVQHDPNFVVLASSPGPSGKGNQGRFSWAKVRQFIVTWCRFVRLVYRHRPHLFFMPLAKGFPHFVRDSLFIWTARMFRVACAAELPGETFYFLGKGRFQTWYGAYVLSHVTCLRVLGTCIAQQLASFGIHNTIVTDNGIALGEDTTSEERDTNSEMLRLLFVGTHSPAKGLDVLIQACHLLSHEGLPLRIAAMGEWISEGYRQDTLRLLDKNGIAEQFAFHGLLHGHAKWSLFAKSDVLVLPSMREGQPLVILEALAHGLAVIATNVGAIPEVITHGIHGFLAEPGSASDIAKAIMTLSSDPALRQRMSESNQHLYRERFTEDMFLRTQVGWLEACATGQLEARGQTVSCPTPHSISITETIVTKTHNEVDSCCSN